MFHDLNVLAGGILVAWFTALLFGMLLIVGLGYIRLIATQSLRRTTDWVMLVLVFVQLLISAAHCALCLQQALYGFVATTDPAAYFMSQGLPTHIGQTALYITNNLIADSVLAWRLYVVYNRNLLIAIPFIIFIIGSGVCGFVGLHILVGRLTLEALFDPTLGHWQDTYWALTITTQVSATALIAWRIWFSQMQVAHSRRIPDSKVMSVLWMILESGATLSITTVILLAFYLENKIAGTVLAAIGGQLAALVPVSMLLRVSLRKVTLMSHSSWAPQTSRSLQRDGQSFPLNTSDATAVAVRGDEKEGAV